MHIPINLSRNFVSLTYFLCSFSFFLLNLFIYSWIMLFEMHPGQHLMLNKFKKNILFAHSEQPSVRDLSISPLFKEIF